MSKKSILKLMMAMLFAISGGAASVSAMEDDGNGGGNQLKSPYIADNYNFVSNIDLAGNASLCNNANLAGVCDQMNNIDWAQLRSNKDICDLLRSKIRQFTNALIPYGFQAQFNNDVFNNLKLSDFEDFGHLVYNFVTIVLKTARGVIELKRELFNFRNGVIKISYTGTEEDFRVFVNTCPRIFNSFFAVISEILRFANKGLVNQKIYYQEYDDYDDYNILGDADIKRAFSRYSKEKYRKKLYAESSWGVIIQDLENVCYDIKILIDLFNAMDDVIEFKSINYRINEAIDDLIRPYLYIRALALKVRNFGKDLKFYHLYPGDAITDADSEDLTVSSISKSEFESLVDVVSSLVVSWRKLEKLLQNNDRRFYVDVDGNWRVVSDKESKIIGEDGEKTAKDILSNDDERALKKIVGGIWDMVMFIKSRGSKNNII